MCPAGPHCRMPYCSFVHATTPLTSPRGDGGEDKGKGKGNGKSIGDSVGAHGAPLPLRLLTGIVAPTRQPTQNPDLRLEQPMSDAEPSEYSYTCLLYTSPSPRDLSTSRMPSSA